MRPSVVYSDLVVHLRIWSRSKGTLFWSILFPIMLMGLFGAIFSEGNQGDLRLNVQDMDDTQASRRLIEGLSEAVEIEEIPGEVEIYDYIGEEGLRAALVIPEGFGSALAASSGGGVETTSLVLYLDPTQSTNGALRGIVEGLAGQLNSEITRASYPQAHDTIIVPPARDIVPDKLKFIDFFLPGVIGLTILSSTIYGTIFRNTKYKEDGILRKLSTTPMKRSEWLLAMMLFMTVTSLLSTTVIIVIGVVVFGIGVSLNPLFLAIVVSAAFAFAGIGMVISRFVHEEETADTAGSAVSLPMMFLAGTFFPLETMPGYLQTIAKLLPLYYVNEGLRDAMIFGDLSGAAGNAAVVLALAVAFFAAGVWLTKWRE